MTKTRPEAQAYARALAEAAPGFIDSINAFVLPAYPLISPVAEILVPAGIEVGAQNVHWADEGPFTGEVSAPMLREIGTTLATVGHAERRALFGDTDETVRARSAAAVRHGLTPLICVGEPADVRQADHQESFVAAQVAAAIDGLSPEEIGEVMFAYEPIWAIGEGSTPATTDQAEAMHQIIRRAILDASPGSGDNVAILYGGSVNLSNAQSLIASPSIDGLFVGRAAWTASGFIELAHIVADQGGTP